MLHSSIPIQRHPAAFLVGVMEYKGSIGSKIDTSHVAE